MQAVQGYRRVSTLLDEGLASILRAMKSYQQQSIILRSWQDVFVDLVQGHVQHLFLSLREGEHRQSFNLALSSNTNAAT